MTYDEIKNTLSQMTDPADKLEFVMELGRDLPNIPANVSPDEIRGCASNVSVYKDDNNNFYGTADSALVRGIVAILFALAGGQTAHDIRAINLSEKFNALTLQLGAGRLNGLAAIIQYLENG